MAKAYIIVEHFDSAVDILNMVLEMCSSNEILVHFSLFQLLGKAQILLAEIYSYKKMQNFKGIERYCERMSLLDQGIENYRLADSFESENYLVYLLEYGMAYKRRAEGHILRNEIELAIDDIRNAVEKYDEVQRKNAILIDAYCKKGFAYETLISAMLKTSLQIKSQG